VRKWLSELWSRSGLASVLAMLILIAGIGLSISAPSNQNRPFSGIVATISLSGPADVVFGEDRTLVAEVSGGSDVPTGSVQFLSDGTRLGSPATLNNGRAALSSSGLQAGAHTITVIYLGDSRFPRSVSQSPLTVNVDPAVVVLDIVPNEVYVSEDHPIDFAVIVNAALPGRGVPTGILNVRDNQGIAPSPLRLRRGSTRVTLPGRAVGSYTLWIEYASDSGNFAKGSRPLVLNVKSKLAGPVKSGQLAGGSAPVPSSGGGSGRSAPPAPRKHNPTLTLKISGHRESGESLVLEVQAAGNNQGVAPTGCVQFMIDGDPVADAGGHFAVNLVNSRAVIPLVAPNAGKHKVSAVYEGDQRFESAVVPDQVIEIGPAEASLNVTAPVHATQGQPFVVEIRAVRTRNNSAARAPDGFVRLTTPGGEVVGAPVALLDGVARIRGRVDQVGPCDLVVEYVAPAGGSNFQIKPEHMRLDVERARRRVTGTSQDLLGTWVVQDGNELIEVTFGFDQEFTESVPQFGLSPDFYSLDGRRLSLGLSPQRSPTGSSMTVERGTIEWLDAPFFTRFSYEVKETSPAAGNAPRTNRIIEFRWKRP
jgi:Bacterial Ig-like domain (group 3)